MAISKKELLELLARKARDKQISCKALFRLSEQTGVTLARLGAACNELKIKIRACQLGCFK